MPLPGSPANALPADDAALMRRIEGIERQLRELGPSVASSIFPIIADLQAQADATDAVVADMAAVLDAQVVPAVGNATTGTTPFATSTTPTNHATITFTVPSGYTRAAVSGVSSLAAFSVPHTVATVIAGTVGEYMEIGLADGTGSSGYARVLTGLTGGGTFTVQTQTRTGSGTGFAHAITTATVTFYR